MDRWYQTYEDSFEEGSDLRVLFERVLSELQAVLPELRRTRWKKRSDFYSLCGALGRIHGSLPLSADQRAPLRQTLLTFAAEVDSAVRATDAATLQLDEQVEDGEDQRFRDDVVSGLPSAHTSTAAERYADAVERAATDLSRRRVREAVLVKLIDTALTQVEAKA